MTRDARTQAIWDLGRFEVGRGLEIGPLHRAVVPRAEGDVRYVDVLDRDGLVAHYGGDAAVDTDLIPDVDFPLVVDGRTRTLVEAAGADGPYDWVMASHVIEHVPDLVGWLEDVAAIVTDGGALVLAVPDKRYCFDLHRPTTTVGAMVEAHDLRPSVPSVRAVYDYFHEVVRVDTARLWKGDQPDVEARIHSREEALLHAERARRGEYVDCHVWMFTPDLFLAQMNELRLDDLSSWYVDACVPTRRNELEFYARLRRVPRGADRSGEVAGELLPAQTRPHAAQDALDARGEVRRLRAELKDARHELAAVRSSATWRVGRAVVGPVGAVRRRLRRT